MTKFRTTTYRVLAPLYMTRGEWAEGLRAAGDTSNTTAACAGHQSPPVTSIACASVVAVRLRSIDCFSAAHAAAQPGRLSATSIVMYLYRSPQDV